MAQSSFRISGEEVGNDRRSLSVPEPAEQRHPHYVITFGLKKGL